MFTSFSHAVSKDGVSRESRCSRALTAVAAAGLLLAATVVVPVTAFAADGPYTIEGIVPDAGTTFLDDPEGNIKELGPLNSNTTKIGVIHADAVPTLGLTNPNGQVDLRGAWLGTEREGTKDWLYFGWERDANSGSGYIAYEFMQDPPPASCAYETATPAALITGCNPWDNRKAGDFMILWDQRGNSLDLFLRTWSGTGDNLTLSPPDSPLNATVSQAAYSADGFRGEAAINLTDTVFGGSTNCRLFANTIPSTVTGNSDNADYKDTILATTPPITNCSSTIVTTPKLVTDTTTSPVTTSNVPSGGASIGTGVVAVRDSAEVGLTGGTATPAGSVAFSLCKVDSPALCDTGGTSVGSTSLTGAAYPVTVQSPTAYVTSAGRYCWRATFSGDSANGIGPRTDARSTECFTVNPVDPTLSTSAGPDVFLGQTVTDSAALGGTATQPASPVINLTAAAGAPAGGTITFKLYGPSDTGCGSLRYTSATVPVSGNGTYHSPAPQFEPAGCGGLPLGGRLQRELAEHQRCDPQRGVHRPRRGRHRDQRGVVHDDCAALGAERLGDNQRASRGQPRRHRVVQAVRLERLRSGRRGLSHLQHHATGLRCIAQDGVHDGFRVATPCPARVRVVLVARGLRQHQRRPTGHSRELSRDVHADREQWRDGVEPVAAPPTLDDRNDAAGLWPTASRCAWVPCGPRPA